MMDELAADILALVQGVIPQSSLTLGGRSDDPVLAKIPLPAAWVQHVKDIPDEQSYTHGPATGVVHEAQSILALYSVLVFVPYTTDTDMLKVQFPLIEALRVAIHAKDAPSGFRWRYAGMDIVRVYTDRLAYEQRYTVDYST